MPSMACSISKAMGTVKLTSEVKLTLPPVKIKFTEIKNGSVSEKASLLRNDFYHPVVMDENGDRIHKSFFNRDVDYQKKQSRDKLRFVQ